MKVYKILYSTVYETYFISVVRTDSIDYGFILFVVDKDKNDYELKPEAFSSLELQNKDNYLFLKDLSFEKAITDAVIKLIITKKEEEDDC